MSTQVWAPDGEGRYANGVASTGGFSSYVIRFTSTRAVHVYDHHRERTMCGVETKQAKHHDEELNEIENLPMWLRSMGNNVCLVCSRPLQNR